MNSKDGVDFAILFTLKTTRKAGGHQILCCQGIKVTDYNFTPDALALKPSGFCNVGVIPRNPQKTQGSSLHSAGDVKNEDATRYIFKV